MPSTVEPAASDDEKRRATQAILDPGRNCWCLEDADRLTVHVDAADYFAAFAETCSRAKRQILILGWDFDRHERLHRGDHEGDLPDELGAFLGELVKRRGDLQIYLLSWDFNMIYAAERELLPAVRLRMQAPRRFHFRLDGVHPNGASHHQKVVVVDDRVAFVGGIDLSRWRWDTCEHKPDDPRRTDPNGEAYPPFHDMMMMVEGDVAKRLGDLARDRWRRARGREIDTPQVDKSPWPERIPADLKLISVAVARTAPGFREHDAIGEVQQLYLDAIAAARDAIYIENQYFTAHAIADALAERLAEEQGPDVVLVLPEKTGGWLEQVTMDVIRARVMARLIDADLHGRLKIYFPDQPGLGDACISVHAKLLIVDDRLLRIGSSNISNRSLGLDTECDLAIESEDDGDDVATFIGRLRSRLLAEHLDCAADDIDRALDEHGGLITAIESLRHKRRSLKPLDCSIPEEVDEMVPDTGVIDPSEPFSPDYFVTEYVPETGQSRGQRYLFLFATVVVAMMVMAAIWHWTPLGEVLSPRQMGRSLAEMLAVDGAIGVSIVAVTVAALLAVPVMLLAAVCGLAFAGWTGFTVIIVSAVLAAVLSFIAGRLLGADVVARLSRTPIDQLRRRLNERGSLAVAVLRLVPIAPFAVFNLVAGNSRLGIWQYLVGSVLGLVPGLGTVYLFAGTLRSALLQPSLWNISIAAGLGGLLVGAAFFIKRWLRTS